jgi:hypothetical protein
MGSRSARVSFWANNTTGSSVSINVVTSYALSSDSFTTQTQINSTAVTIATGWAKYTVSIASMSSSSQNGVSVRFAIGALAAANSLSFTGVQFEIGPAVTTFENRPLGMEQSLCYRYYQRFMSNSTYTSLIFGSGTCVSTTNALIWVKHKQAMRASPTLSSSVSANNLIVTDTSDHLVTSFGTSNLGNNSVVIAATTSGLTLGRAVTFGANASAAAYIALSSEL